MGYMHIENLYRPEAQRVLAAPRVYALEKVHGTSAHVAWKDGQLRFHSGGEKHERFTALFDHDALREAFIALGHPEVVVYGEAYGGKQQGMSATYGPDLRFIAFDVAVLEEWRSVPEMAEIAAKLGLEVVPWREVPADLATLDYERDRPSEVAVRRGILEPKVREGIVIRPLVEACTAQGARIIAKHKGTAFSERASTPKVVDPSQLVAMQEVASIVEEWVVPMRLEHVLDKLRAGLNRDKQLDITHTRDVIGAMVEDVYREAKGEIVESRELASAIGRKTALMFREWLAKLNA